MSTTSFRAPAKRSPASMPEYQRQNFATPGADASARLSDSAAGIYERGADQTGRQLMALGGAMQQAAKVGDALYVYYQTTKAKDAWLTYKQEAAKKQAELATLQGKNALGESGVEAQLSQWQQTARQNLSKNLGGMATRLFDNAVSQTNADMDAWAVGKVHTEAMRYENKTSEAHISLLQDEALANANNPAELSTRLLGIKNELNAIAGRSGLDETWVNAEFKSDQQKILTKAIADRIEGEQMGEAASLIRTYGSELGGTADTLKARFRAKGRELEARARADQERAERARVNSISNTAWENTKGLTSEERLSAGVEHIAALTDSPKEREKALQLFQANLKFQDTQEKSADLQAARQAVREGKTQQMPPTDFSVYLTNQVEMTERARNYAWADYMGNIKPDTKNRTELDAILVDIDSGKISQTREVEKRAMDGRLTSAQTDKALNYLKSGGKDGELSISSVNTLYKDMTKKENAPVGLFDAVISVLPQGKKPTQEELRKAIANVVLTKGESDADALFFTQNESYSSALKSGRGDKWLPEVTAEENKKYAEMLRREGLPATDKNIRLYKKKEMGIPFSGKE